MSLQGNVLNPAFAGGADPTGLTDSQPAIQAALNSDFAVFFPPGTYRLDSELVITKPKLIECFGGAMTTGYIELGDTVSVNPASTYEQVRFVWNGSSSGNMVRYEISKVFWHGGCFDVQGVSGYDGNIFYLPNRWESQVGGRIDGYGFGVQGATFIGNSNEVRAGTAAPVGVNCDMSVLDRNAAYQYHGIIDIRAVGMDTAMLVTPRGSVDKTANSNEYQIRCRDTKRAVQNLGSADSWLRVWHTGGPIFGSQAEADSTPSVEIALESCVIDLSLFHNFDQGGSGSEWYNSKTYKLDGPGYLNRPLPDAVDRAISISEQQIAARYELARFGATGGTALFGATEAQLQSSSSAVNQSVGKRDGMMVYVTDNATNTAQVPVVVATGGNPTDTWRSTANPTTVYSPS